MKKNAPTPTQPLADGAIHQVSSPSNPATHKASTPLAPNITPRMTDQMKNPAIAQPNPWLIRKNGAAAMTMNIAAKSHFIG